MKRDTPEVQTGYEYMKEDRASAVEGEVQVVKAVEDRTEVQVVDAGGFAQEA